MSWTRSQVEGLSREELIRIILSEHADCLREEELSIQDDTLDTETRTSIGSASAPGATAVGRVEPVVEATQAVDDERSVQAPIQMSSASAPGTSDVGQVAAEVEARQAMDDGQTRGPVKLPFGVVLPASNSTSIFIWEMTGIFLLIITAFELPFRIAFDDWYSLLAIRNWTVFELLCDGFFLSDVVLNCNMAFYDSTGILEVSRRKILVEYARTWMLIDVLGAFPVDWCLPGGFPPPGLRLLTESPDDRSSELLRITRTSRLAKVGKLLKLFKLLRLAKLTRVSFTADRASAHMRDRGLSILVSESAVQVLRYLFIFILLSHIVACVEFFAARVLWPDAWIGGDFEEGATWVFEPYLIPTYSHSLYNRLLGVSAVQWMELTQLYSGAMFNAIGQLLGVHVALSSPRTVPEFWLSIAIVAFGMLLYAGFLGMISGSIDEAYAMRRDYRKKMKQVVNYVRHHKVEPALAKKLILFYTLQHPHEQLAREEEILNEISPSLRLELKLHQLKKFMHALRLDADPMSKDLGKAITEMVQREVYLMGESLLEYGRPNKYGLYVVIIGRVELLGKGGKFLLFKDSDLEGAQIFGEASLLTQTNSLTTVRVSTYCQCFRLPVKGFKQLCLGFPKFEARLKAHLQSLIDESAPVLSGLEKRDPIEAARAYERGARSSKLAKRMDLKVSRLVGWKQPILATRHAIEQRHGSKRLVQRPSHASRLRSASSDHPTNSTRTSHGSGSQVSGQI